MKYLLLCLLFPLSVSAQRLMVLEGKAQGTYYIIKYLSTDTTSLQPRVDSVFDSIDQSLSLYKPASLINQFNENGQVQMDTHMQAVITKALRISKMTAGAFDVTVKPLVDAWGFGVHRPAVQQVPGKDSIRKVLQHVGYRYLKIEGNVLRRLKAGVEIDCNGIAQGYTSDQIGHLLEESGIRNYLVDVGGELCSKGVNAQRQPWTIGIERPAIDSNDYPVQAMVSLPDKAITTSGNYRRFFDQGGTRFAHIIDPVSGQALHNNIISVTVIAKDAITADGFDNALILMGVEKAMTYIRRHPDLQLEAYFIYKDAAGKTQERFSPGFQQLLKK